MAVTAHISGTLATGAIVRMLEDGSIVLNTGATDIGQGSDTVLGQICAATLMVDPREIAIAGPDTDGSPYNWGTTASRVTYTTGRSVQGAAREVERQAKEQAAEILECSIADLSQFESSPDTGSGFLSRAVAASFTLAIKSSPISSSLSVASPVGF